MPTLEENVNRVKAAKTAIGAAITAKGGTVASGDGLEEFAADIATIPDYKPTLTDLIERDIRSIDIPDSVTSIGANAFNDCRSLQTITIPDSVTSIGDSAFNDCRSLQTITIPNSVTSIGSYAFYNCRSLQTITIPNSVTSIGANAFSYTGLNTITINKPEGSISGAPWGATNATVVWVG